MPEQRCTCGHPYSLHRLNHQIADRNECWASIPGGGWCSCRAFMICRQYRAAQATSGADRQEGKET